MCSPTPPMIWMLITLQNLVINSSLTFACFVVFKVVVMHALAGMLCQIYGVLFVI